MKKQPRAANGRYQEIAHHGYALLAIVLYYVVLAAIWTLDL